MAIKSRRREQKCAPLFTDMVFVSRMRDVEKAGKMTLSLAVNEDEMTLTASDRSIAALDQLIDDTLRYLTSGEPEDFFLAEMHSLLSFIKTPHCQRLRLYPATCHCFI